MYVVLFWPLSSPGGRGKPWVKYGCGHHGCMAKKSMEWHGVNPVQSPWWHFSGLKLPLPFPPMLRASPATPVACQAQKQFCFQFLTHRFTHTCTHMSVLTPVLMACLSFSLFIFKCQSHRGTEADSLQGYLLWPPCDPHVWAILLGQLYLRAWLWAGMMCRRGKHNSFVIDREASWSPLT